MQFELFEKHTSTNKFQINHRGPTQSVCVVNCFL